MLRNGPLPLNSKPRFVFQSAVPAARSKRPFAARSPVRPDSFADNLCRVFRLPMPLPAPACRENRCASKRPSRRASLSICGTVRRCETVIGLNAQKPASRKSSSARKNARFQQPRMASTGLRPLPVHLPPHPPRISFQRTLKRRLRDIKRSKASPTDSHSPYPPRPRDMRPAPTAAALARSTSSNSKS